MLKKQGLVVMAACLLSLTVSGSSWSLNLTGPGRPLLFVDGTTRPDLAVEIISLVYDSDLNRLDVTLNNWDPAMVSYKHSDSSLFLPGVPMTVFMGSENQQVRVFDGTATAMASHFNSFSPSTLTVTATGSPRDPKSNLIHLALGDKLTQFDATLSPSGLVTCTGVTEGNPEIQVGTSISVTGVGQRFSQVFHVTRVFHAFDGTKGYTTQFTASTRVESGLPAPKLKGRLPLSLK